MMLNEKRICEYFIISGFNKTRKPYDLSQIYYQGEEICNANVETATDFFHYTEPIVDIKIVNTGQRERPPEGYRMIERTYSNLNKADLNGKASIDELYLCFRFGRDQPPITDLWALNPKEKNFVNQDNWNLVDKTVSGHSANLHTSSSSPLFVAFRRAPVNAPVDNLVVTDICIILTNKNEICPPAYSRVDVPIKRSTLSHTVNICYKKSIVKQHVLTFQPEVIYCLPSSSTSPIVDVYNTDLDECRMPECLPEDVRDVANFCMPWGATLESWPTELRTPRPSFVTFVLTNTNYNRMYGAALLFYEYFDKSQLTEEETINLGLNVEGIKNMNVFASKSICFLSRWPLFQTFHKVLTFLIQEDERQRCGVVLESSPVILPLERFISHFLHVVPFPTPQTPNILLQWDLDNPIGIQLPTDAISKFGTSENFYNLIRMMDVEEIIKLFVYMLTEQKILLTSTCNTDLTGIAEALISMIFPFKWSVVYIPFLYLSCIHIIQSPSPYLIGVDSRFFDYFRLPEGVGCIDLINKSIKPPDVNCKYLDPVKVLPKSVLRSLRNGLLNCKTKVTSFEKQQSLRKTTGNLIDEFTVLRKKEVIGESIRECFLRAVILMFKNYQRFLLPLSHRQKEYSMFNVEGFIKSVDKNSRPLYQAIFDTQLWNNFVRERSYATEFDDSLAFFDRCIKQVQVMDETQVSVSSLLQTDSVIESEHTKVLQPPDPVEGWCCDVSRTTFPWRLDSALMLASPDARPARHADSSLVTPQSHFSSEHECGSTTSLSCTDSSIPVLLLRADCAANGCTMHPSRPTILKRPFDEQKQALQLGKEAKRGPNYAWAGHLLTSSYCLWYLSLPGLIGYVTDTAGLSESGLAERILQLAIQMLDSICSNRLLLPDEVCYRVLLLLVHQVHSPRVHVADIRKHADLNAFSYGLCNQILLEEETHMDSATANETGQSNMLVAGKGATCKGDSKDEVDCDSGRDTLASNNNVSTGPTEGCSLTDSKCPSNHNVIEIGGKAVRLRGRFQGPNKRAGRMSQVLFQSNGEGCVSHEHWSRQLFDQSAGIIMTSAPRDPSSDCPPVLALHKLTPLADETPIILDGPGSEEKFTPEKDSSCDDCPAQALNVSQVDSDPAPTNVTTKSRASFRQLKSAANKSLKSVRSVMSSVGVGSWLAPVNALVPLSDIDGRGTQLGMPSTFRPWEQAGNGGGRETRLKTTVSADVLNTIEDEPDGVMDGRRCVGTVQQSRRRPELGTHWTLDGSSESVHSDSRMDRSCSSNSLDTDPPIVVVDRIWETITDSLAAVQLPAGTYWCKDDVDNGSPSPSVTCKQRLILNMTTCSVCDHCRSMVYDDDILAGWTYDDSDLQSRCPSCDNRFTPRLTFQAFVRPVDMDDSHGSAGGSHQCCFMAFANHVNYLSPFVLRKEVESVLHQEGEVALLRPQFLQDHSILYWNMIWYYSRLSLPSHMLSFVTLWLQQKGRSLAMTDVQNKSKYDAYVALTGHEQVLVRVAWELQPQFGRTGLPLYRQFNTFGCSHNLESSVSADMPSLRLILDCLFKSDISSAIQLILQSRSLSTTVTPLVTTDLSIYRELMFLAITAFDVQGLNLDTFYFMYYSNWPRIVKTHAGLVSTLDQPPSEIAFYCRKAFRRLLLV